MPSKKKGKKAASSTARGFATVSTASKPKAPIDEKKAENNPVAENIAADTHDAVEQKAGSDTVQTKQNVAKPLSPEELERQLREDELQLLIEKSGDQVKRDALRNATRLKTDRRLLRGQSETVNLRIWMPEEHQSAILDLQRQERANSKDAPVVSTLGSQSLGVSDDVLLRLWQLRRTLKELDFASEDVDTVILTLLKSPEGFQDDIFKKTPTTTFGLEQCLTWLGLNEPAERLPDYFTLQNSIVAKQAQDEELTQEKRLQERLRPTQSELSRKPADELPTKAEEVEMSSSEDEDFDADNPEHLQQRYVRLMTRLFKLRPEMTEVPHMGKRKKKQAPSPVNPAAVTPRVQKLLGQIKLLESDMLFDKDSAQIVWFGQRQDLLMDIPVRVKQKDGPKPASNGDGSSGVSIQPDDEQDEQDGFVGLGGLMNSLPDETETSAAISDLVTSNPVQTRDFGKWTGTSPRKILEDVCRSRDAGVKLTFHPLSQNLCKRFALDISWTTPQDLQLDCPATDIYFIATTTRAYLAMEGMGAIVDAQAEAYISTVALFALFSISTKEEKAYMRLPTVWRNVYTELRDLMKLKVEAADKAELGALRDLIEANIDTAMGEDVQRPERFEKPLRKSHTEADIPSVEKKEETGDPEYIRGLWNSKSSTPAFATMERTRSNLPMWAFKEQLISAIDSNQVVIVCGETGCGKSTQTPNFILEHEMSSGRDCKIYVTEPRRISAISLAQRVSQELGENRGDLGTRRSLVGYSIRLESKLVSSTRLVYATTGVVMRMLERNPDLSEITHLILDEVHERTIDSDFLLIILRRLLVKRPSLKVILMSATVNAERFSSYLHGAPVFNVPGRTFPVEVQFLEDAIEITKYGSMETHNSRRNPRDDILDDEDRVTSDEDGKDDAAKVDLSTYSVATRNAIKEYNEYRINYELILKLLEVIAKDARYREYSKAVLVFLPGINEIRRVNDMLSGHPVFSRDWQIFPLHSTIAIEEQERAFRIPPRGVRKVVLATNIAETGITIPDITCVIDTGTHKEMRYDERRQLSRLIEAFISKANAKQRRGRAGRVQNGLCFHLFTRDRHDRLMAPQQTPEIMRLSLQDLVLRVKICELGEVEATLAEALDAPSAKNIRRAIDHLIDVKALTSDERLTHLGRQLSKLPLDVFLGKLLLLGSIYRNLDSCLSFAAILSSRSPFSAPMGAKSQADQVRLSFKKADSDLMTVYNAYSAWRRVCKTQGASGVDFCRRNFLNSQTLGNIEELKAQLTSSLIDAGFIQATEELKASLGRVRSYSRQPHFVELPETYTVNDANDVIVDSVIAWSFYPKLIARDGKGWRSVTSNQPVVVHPTSVNKVGYHGRFLSYYHLMQSAGKAYNAHETSAAEDFAVALACGDADFRLYAGVVAIDSNRLRLALPSWRSMLALKYLRTHVLEICEQKFRNPAKQLSDSQEKWLELWQRCFDERNTNSR